MKASAKYWAVVPAAGIGSRMATNVAKQYLPLLGQCVLEHTLAKLLTLPELSAIVVAVRSDDTLWPTLAISTHPKIITTVGGLERADSVGKGLQALAEFALANDWVLVHDAARPCISIETLSHLVATLDSDPVGGILAVPVADTLKRAGVNFVLGQTMPHITTTVDRVNLWQAQTPQMFRYAALRSSLSRADAEKFRVTDEASAMEFAGYTPKLVQGRSDNIKITTPEDLELAELILRRQQARVKS